MSIANFAFVIVAFFAVNYENAFIESVREHVEFNACFIVYFFARLAVFTFKVCAALRTFEIFDVAFLGASWLHCFNFCECMAFRRQLNISQSFISIFICKGFAAFRAFIIFFVARSGAGRVHFVSFSKRERMACSKVFKR